MAGSVDSGGGGPTPLFVNYAFGNIPHEYKSQTQNEMYLWNAWKQAEEKINRLEEMIRSIKEKNQLNDEPIENIQQYG